jgi:hypothetical protein
LARTFHSDAVNKAGKAHPRKWHHPFSFRLGQRISLSINPTRTTMFKFTDKGSVTTCDGVTRRDFLSAGALSAIGLTMPGFAKLKAEGKVDPKRATRPAS